MLKTRTKEIAKHSENVLLQKSYSRATGNWDRSEKIPETCLHVVKPPQF